MILYYQADGKIIGGCAADSPDVVITHIPSGCQALYLDDTEHGDVWTNMAEYTIQNGAPIFTPIPDSVKLANAQTAQVAALHTQMEQAVASFPSGALGTNNTYLADPTSMSLLLGAYGRLTGPNPPANYSVNWYTVEQGRVPHNAAQIIQVFEDGTSYIQQQYDHYASLEQQVQAATSVDQVNAITW